MAAWPLPQEITDWCEFLSTTLDRRRRKYFLTVILGIILASGRRTVSSWLRAAGVGHDWQDQASSRDDGGRRFARDCSFDPTLDAPFC